MSSKVGSDSSFRDSFLYGAARAMFVMAYADHVENSEEDLPRPGPGGDWYDYAPEAPPNAYALAGGMWSELHAANGEAGVYSLALRAEAADGAPVDAEEFGRDLAMQYMGSGVSWFDDHAEFEVKIPHAEIGMYSFSDEAYRGE